MIKDQEKTLLTKLNHYAERLRVDYKVPGISLSIVHDDFLVTAKGIGVRKWGENIPVDGDSIFGIASISKSFTAMALGMLVDEGKIKWSDKVTKYLPAFRLYDRYATREMTILDLLVHRSGLPSVSGGTIWYGSNFSRQEVIARLQYLKPAASFRGEYAYQNITYLVAGEIVQELSDQSWDEFVTQRVFNPLNMNSSNTSIKKLTADMNVAQPHIEINGKPQAIPHRNYDNVGPAASINTTARDLAAYAQLLLNGGAYKGQFVYSPEVGRDLWTPQSLVPMNLDYPHDIRSIMPQFHSTYALGWQIQDYFGTRKIFHSGGIDGLRSRLALIPDQKLGVAVVANNEGPAPWILSEIILDLYRGADPQLWYGAALDWWAEEKAKLKGIGLDSPSTITKPSLDLCSYQGVYYSRPVGEIRVDEVDEQLVLRFPHTESFTGFLSHWRYDTFRVKWLDPVVPDGLITFVLDAKGHVSELRLTQAKLLDVDFAELHPITRIKD